MKTREKWLISLLALCFAVPAHSAGVSSDEKKADRLATEFNVPASELLDIHNNQKLSWSDIKTALAISDRSGASLKEVVQLKQSGMKFKDIAQRYNLDWKEVKSEKHREMRDAPRSDQSSQSDPALGADKDESGRIASEFGVSKQEVESLRQKNLSYDDIRNALTVSQKAGVSVNEVVELKDSGMTWDQIGNKYNVKLENTGKGSTGGTEELKNSPNENPSNQPMQKNDSGTTQQENPGGAQHY